MPQELIAVLMFSTMLLLMMTGQRVFGLIGFVAVVAAIGYGIRPIRQVERDLPDAEAPVVAA